MHKKVSQILKFVDSPKKQKSKYLENKTFFSWNKKKISHYILRTTNSDVYRAFLHRPVHTSNSQRHHHSWCREDTFSKLMSGDALKMHSLTLSGLRFLWTFLKLLKFALWSTLPRGWFLKNSYIHKQNMYGYKFVGTGKWSELKLCRK